MLKEQPSLVFRHRLRFSQELLDLVVHLIVHGRTLYRRRCSVIDQNFAVDLLQKFIGDLRGVDHLNLGIDSKVDGELLEGLDPAMALAVAANHGALPPADGAADLAIETGAVVAHLDGLHGSVAGGIRDVPHFGACAVTGAVAPGAVDLAETLTVGTGRSTPTVAALARTDMLGVRDWHLLRSLLEVRRFRYGDIPRTRRLAPVIDGP